MSNNIKHFRVLLWIISVYIHVSILKSPLFQNDKSFNEEKSNFIVLPKDNIHWTGQKLQLESKSWNEPISFLYIVTVIWHQAGTPSDTFPPPRPAGRLMDSLNSWDWAHRGLLSEIACKKLITPEKWAP